MRWALGTGAGTTIALLMAAFMTAHRAREQLSRANQQLEDRVLERTHDMRFLFDTMPQLVWTASVGGAIQSLNYRWLQYLGVGTEQEGIALIGQVTHPDDAEAAVAEWQGMLREARPGGGEARLRRHDGAWCWHLWRAFPQRDAAGGVVRWIGTSTDISTQKGAAALLERRVLDRTAELSASRDTALAASRSKSAFLATISHEIRTPMNGIVGMANLLMDRPLPAEEKEMVQIIDQSADSLLGIISDILDFSKIEAGKLTIEPRDFNFGELVATTSAMFVSRAAEKRIHFQHRTDSRLLDPLRGDARRIRQILTNLIGNAVKFTDEGGVSVDTELTGETGTHARLRCVVRDTGGGISPEGQEKLFQPFSQVDASDEKRFGGTGLGLAICRQLLGLMGGEIGCTSGLGRGSEFWFTLELPWAGGEKSSPTQILVIDDDSNDRKLIVAMLSRLGIQAESATSGEAGLSRLRASLASGRSWDLVLVDQRMPGMTGLDFGRALRADPLLASIPIALMSGGALSEPTQADAIGFEGVLAKPVREDQLRRSLRRFSTVGPSPTVTPAADRAFQPAKRQPADRSRLLIVDDNEANRKVARLTLAKFGIESEAVASGAEALEHLASLRFAAVLMDCQMPGMSGYETTRRIREGQIPGLDPHLPVIALTAYASPGDLEKCREAGMNDRLVKPVRGADLCEVLQRYGIAPGKAAGTAPGREVPDSPLLDRRYIGELRSMPGERGGSLWDNLVETFRETVPERLARMNDWARDRRAADLAQAAHRFAGSCANVGAAEVRMLALELERHAEREDWVDVDRGLVAARLAVERFLDCVGPITPSRSPA